MEISDQTCFENEVDGFSMVFLLCVSGNTLCVISIDRCIIVAHNKYHEGFVTRKLLTIVIICVILTSFLWATLQAVFKGSVETVKVARLYMALPAGTVYLALL